MSCPSQSHDLITLTICAVKYNICSSSLCSFLQPPEKKVIYYCHTVFIQRFMNSFMCLKCHQVRQTLTHNKIIVLGAISFSDNEVKNRCQFHLLRFISDTFR